MRDVGLLARLGQPARWRSLVHVTTNLPTRRARSTIVVAFSWLPHLIISSPFALNVFRRCHPTQIRSLDALPDRLAGERQPLTQVTYIKFICCFRCLRGVSREYSHYVTMYMCCWKASTRTAARKQQTHRGVAFGLLSWPTLRLCTHCRTAVILQTAVATSTRSKCPSDAMLTRAA